MIYINEINNGKDVEIECLPPYNKTIKEVFRKSKISHIRLLDAPDIGNTIKIYLSERTIELNYSIGIFINQEQAVDNDDLYNKLLAIFSTP